MLQEPEIPYRVIEKAVNDFSAFLAANAITVSPGSRLEETVTSVKDLVQGKIAHPSRDYRDHFRRLFGAFYVISKILRNCEHADFQNLIPHIEKLCEVEFTQNAHASILDRDADKMIELVVGAACLQFCQSVKLDHPKTSSGGRNPDVIAEFNGKSFGLACKTLHSFNAGTIFAAFEKGLNQLARASTDFGFVIITLKNVMPHDAIWPLAGYRAYEGVLMPQYRSTDGGTLSKAINEYVGDHMLSFLSAAFQGRPPQEILIEHKDRRCLVFFFQFMTSFGKKPSLLAWLYGIQIITVPPEVAGFIQQLNEALQVHYP